MQSPIRWAKGAAERFRRLDVHTTNDSWKGAAFKPRHPFWLAEGLARLLLFTARELRQANGKAPRCRILVSAGTLNNYRSAEPVFADMEDAEIVTFHNFAVPGRARLRLFRSYLTGLASLPLLPLLVAAEQRPHVRRAMRLRFDHLALSLGSRAAIRRFLKASGADIFVTLSNLTVYNNLFVEEARRLGMATVFMTHAPVGRGQPPLETDFAFLDGEFQMRLFPPGRAELIVTGSARGEALSSQWRDRGSEQGVIVATNTLLTDLGKIERMVVQLTGSDRRRKVLLRPHPRDERRFNAHREICRRTGAAFSDPATPLSKDADGCKYLVTGISGIAVDALLLGLYPLILRSPELDAASADLPDDYYGLFELGLARRIDLERPALPDDWRMGRELYLLEASAQPGWSAKAKISEALREILRERDSGGEIRSCFRVWP